MSSHSADWLSFFKASGKPVTLHYQVPRVNTGTKAIEGLLSLLSKIEDDIELQSHQNLTVKLGFTNCTFLAHHGVAVLGGLIRNLEARGVTVLLEETSISPDVRRNLIKNGFLKEFAKQGGRQAGNTIQYRQHLSSNEEESVIRYLETEWLGRGFVSLSGNLKDVIVGKVWEIYTNAFEHSGSDLGVFSCGQYYPAIHALNLTVVDFGCGIPDKVRAYKRSTSIKAASALQWAMQRGTSTGATTGIVRGLGLAILREFIHVNGGSLEIISNDGLAIVCSGGDRFESIATPFKGTIVNINIICKGTHYMLASEASGFR